MEKSFWIIIAVALAVFSAVLLISLSETMTENATELVGGWIGL